MHLSESFCSRSHNDLATELRNLYRHLRLVLTIHVFWNRGEEKKKEYIHAGVNTALLSKKLLSLVRVEYMLYVLFRVS